MCSKIGKGTEEEENVIVEWNGLLFKQTSRSERIFKGECASSILYAKMVYKGCLGHTTLELCGL